MIEWLADSLVEVGAHLFRLLFAVHGVILHGLISVTVEVHDVFDAVANVNFHVGVFLALLIGVGVGWWAVFTFVGATAG